MVVTMPVVTPIYWGVMGVLEVDIKEKFIDKGKGMFRHLKACPKRHALRGFFKFST